MAGRLGMVDTGFEVPAAKRDRLTSSYRRDVDGGLELAAAPDGQFSHPPAFPAGSGGLASTADDWHRFARLLLGGGTVDDRRGFGGTGTTAHIVPSTGTVAILLTQVALNDPVAPAIMRDFWRHAA